MASPDDLIPLSHVLIEIRDAGLPGIDKAALAERRYGHVYRLFADGRIRAERTGRILNVRRKQLPDVAVGLGVAGKEPLKPSRAKRTASSSNVEATA